MTSVCVLVQSSTSSNPRAAQGRGARRGGVFGRRAGVAPKFPEGETFPLDGVTVYTCALDKKRASRLRYVYEYATFFLWCVRQDRQAPEAERFSVVDVNTLPDFLVFAGFLAKWRGAKLLLDMHEITPEFMMSKYEYPRGKWHVRLAAWLELISMKYADHVLTINQPIDELLMGRGLSPASPPSS